MMYRKSISDDCKAIYSLICEMENKELPYDRFEEIYNQQINESNYYCLVCEQDDKVIGMLNLRFEEQLHHSERIAEILELAVSDAYRSRGIGKELLDLSCQIAKDNDCSQIELACNQLRKDAHRFYTREGMNNFHFKFSKRLLDFDSQQNILGG